MPWRNAKPASRLLRATVAMMATLGPAHAQQSSCGLENRFERPDEQGRSTVVVYASRTASASGGGAVAFITPLKVNTDGTRISYKVDDPRANATAINDIRNAFNNPRRPISDFEALANSDWKPTSDVWKVLSPRIIERDRRPGTAGRPCVDAEGYLVSMTAVGTTATSSAHEGDCDQAKWLDALTVPSIVLPKSTSKHPSQFLNLGASLRSVAIVMNLAHPQRMAFGLVGDTGPVDELGEASVAMNRDLNGLPSTDNPKNHSDANARFQAGRSMVLLLTGKDNVVPFPLTESNVVAFAKQRFESWGGLPRLSLCRHELGGGN
jgi:hypothetical protein